MAPSHPADPTVNLAFQLITAFETDDMQQVGALWNEASDKRALMMAVLSIMTTLVERVHDSAGAEPGDLFRDLARGWADRQVG
ncbi:MAG TPA: hypothetical protein VMR18_03185 [Candidatus Saccharimonadales bacterium]|jgi:hypothetical protein|nr:hypothetical protein [Candidatus Saccharimonadales bacterium]